MGMFASTSKRIFSYRLQGYYNTNIGDLKINMLYNKKYIIST